MKKIKKYLKEIIVFLILLGIGLNLVSYYKSIDLNKEDLLINEFTLLDNTKYTIDKTKPLLIYFWGSWCPICKMESPIINELSKDIQVIGIAVNSGSDNDIKNYMKKNGFKFKNINDKNGTLVNKFNISVFPTIMIYDKTQKLKFSEVGYTSSFGLKLKLFISNL